MTITMMSGGACQVRYPCGHMDFFGAFETIPPCRACDPYPPPRLVVVPDE